MGTAAFVVSFPLFAGLKLEKTGIYKIAEPGQFFSSNELTILTDVANLMIPKTDTPGASDAHVPEVLDPLMLTWAGANTKKQFRDSIKQLDHLANETYKSLYTDLNPQERFTMLNELDKLAFANKATSLSQNYRKLKEVIFHIYYTSEEANPDYVRFPGTYKGCLSKTEYDLIVNKRLGRAS